MMLPVQRVEMAVARGVALLFPLGAQFAVIARSAGAVALRIPPLTLADIAAQAAVTPRALQYAFRRKYDTAPMSYLRQVRLERACQDLLGADPAAGHTVAAIARRWGFTRQDRFAAAYLAVYGRPPSHTLRR